MPITVKSLESLQRLLSIGQLLSLNINERLNGKTSAGVPFTSSQLAELDTQISQLITQLIGETVNLGG